VEDLVAVELRTSEGASCYFITWGRIQDAVDPRPLEALIRSVASHFAIPGVPTEARLCNSLQEARDAPLFYEALFAFAQKPIPFGADHEKWRSQMDELMRSGKEIYFAGPFGSSGSK